MDGLLKNKPCLLVMSPRAELARAIARAEGFSAWLGSWPFHFSSELKIDWKTSWNFNSQLKTYFLLFSIIKLTKLCIWIKLFTFKNTKVQINDHKIDWNHDTGLLIITTWGKNELKKFRFSSVSARKLKCPSSARLGTFIARLELENSSSNSSLVCA